MEKLMKAIRVLQFKKGKHGGREYRLNPYNPISYIVILISLIAAIIMHGVVGFKRGMDWKNPFEWR